MRKTPLRARPEHEVPDARAVLAAEANSLAGLGDRFLAEGRPEVAGPFLSAAGILASAVWSIADDLADHPAISRGAETR
ncbi:MAG: hypothetical protein J7474_11490 [Arthrobacter sp.]|nr:hypothetical protein [Arthrobacter sp.]